MGSQFLYRFAVTHKNDHASQCTFTFSDGRRCRTPRTANHSHFCFDHAQKEARATETLGKELALLLLRRLPLRLRSQRRPRSPHPRRRSRRYKKPRTARTVAYLAQTLLQSIRLAQHEYINAFSAPG